MDLTNVSPEQITAGLVLPLRDSPDRKWLVIRGAFTGWTSTKASATRWLADLRRESD